MNHSNRKVLVTGAAGFTGGYMVEHLIAEGFDVVPVVHSNKATNRPVKICDLTDYVSVLKLLEEVRPNYIIHLAAQSFVGHGTGADFYQVNIFSATNILGAICDAGLDVTKVLIASSANVYGAAAVSEKISESLCPQPINHYAASKLAMEHMVRTWFDKVPVILTRPFNYTGYGQDQKFLIPKLVKHFREKSEVISLGNIDVSRDFSDVRDVVRAYSMLLDTDCRSETLNVCSGRAYSVSDAIEFLQELSGYQIEVRVNPSFVRENEISRLVGVNDKLRSWIQYTPEYNLFQTLEDMYRPA